MRTSVARRQRHRRLGDKRRPRGNGAARVAVVALPLFLFGTLLLVGLFGAGVVVAGYSYYAKDLQDPKQALDAITFTSQTVVYDRTGQVTLATLGTDRRTIVTYDEIPKAMIDATTSIEDKTFWENAGFDPLGFVSAALDTLSGANRGGSTITQQLVRARLLPESAFSGSVYDRKAKEIIQSIRLTQAYPGEAGKQAIMEKYLNQNFYGNRSYGVAAAALSYFGKELKDLSLAEMAILAGIPQSPTQYDLVKNAIDEPYTDANGKPQTHLVVPPDSPIVLRRNYILDLMKTRSVLTKGQYTDADYEAAKAEPVILASQAADQWRAPQFVWQVRNELGQIICGSSQCQEIDTGGYSVVTTLDYRMQRIVEKWVYAAAIAPDAPSTNAILTDRQIPKSQWGWIRALIGHNIHNAAGGVVDYRTGDILAYAGSASYTDPGTKTFQPQFDVLSDGWRQPGSAIKPVVYAIGIDDHTMTASTVFMDVATNFMPPGAAPWVPVQADLQERGPVRLRGALEFSLNVPAIKAGFVNGLDHQLQRSRDFGIRYPAGTIAVPSMSIGTLEIHPIDLISAYGTIANGGVLVPHRTILKVFGPDGKQVWPATDVKPAGTRVISADAAYIITDILAGNTNKNVNPFWAKWAITDGIGSGTLRPAAYKTGTTSDNRDVLAMGYLPPPSDATLPALVAGVWMGNSDNSPNDGKLSLDTSAPLWSAILSEVSQGMPIASFAPQRPKDLVTATIDPFTGMLPGPLTTTTMQEIYIPGTAPTRAADTTTTADIDEASGLLWQDGCAGPKVTKTFIDFSRLEANFPAWQAADIGWQARAAQGISIPGGPATPKKTYTMYFYAPGWYPFGATWGGTFPPTTTCPIPLPPTPCISLDPSSPCPPPTPCISTDPAAPCPSIPAATPPPTPAPTPVPSPKGGPKPTPTPIPTPKL